MSWMRKGEIESQGWREIVKHISEHYTDQEDAVCKCQVYQVYSRVRSYFRNAENYKQKSRVEYDTATQDNG